MMAGGISFLENAYPYSFAAAADLIRRSRDALNILTAARNQSVNLLPFNDVNETFVVTDGPLLWALKGRPALASTSLEQASI